MIAILLAMALTLQPAGPRAVVERWTGRVDKGAVSAAPPSSPLRTSEELAHLWKAWQIKAALPKVDFSRHLLLVYTATSSVFQLRSLSVDAGGDLKAVLVATPDMTADYAYIIALVDRAGVKSIEGRPLP